MKRSSALWFMQCMHVQLHFLHCAFHPCYEERRSSNMFERISRCKSHLSVTPVSAIHNNDSYYAINYFKRRRCYISFSSNDFITKAKISFHRVKKLNNKKKVFIAFTNCTVLVGTANAKWFLLTMTGLSSQQCRDLTAYHQSRHCKIFLYVKHLSTFWPPKPYRF